MTEDRKIKTLEEQYQGVSIRDLQTDLTRLPYKEQTNRQMVALHSGNTGVSVFHENLIQRIRRCGLMTFSTIFLLKKNRPSTR